MVSMKLLLFPLMLFLSVGAILALLGINSTRQFYAELEKGRIQVERLYNTGSANHGQRKIEGHFYPEDGERSASLFAMDNGEDIRQYLRGIGIKENLYSVYQTTDILLPCWCNVKFGKCTFRTSDTPPNAWNETKRHILLAIALGLAPLSYLIFLGYTTYWKT